MEWSHPLPDGRKLLIREGVAADASKLVAYFGVTSKETTYFSSEPNELDADETKQAETFARFQQTDNQVYLLGFIDGALVTSLSFEGGTRARLRHAGELGMAVVKSCWGLGIGGHMLRALIDWARDSGVITKINLRVRRDNARAIALYKRAGFALEGTIRRDMRVDGRYYDHHCMGLIVA